MVQLLCIEKDSRVLEIGTGSGYETAVLAELAGDVFSVERIESLANKARDTLAGMGYNNIHIKIGDGTLGWQEFVPFDKIIVTASSGNIPRPLIDQLREGGKMVIPIGPRFSQRMLLLEKQKGRIMEKDVCGCVFVPLIGEHGWRENSAAKDS